MGNTQSFWEERASNYANMTYADKLKLEGEAIARDVKRRNKYNQDVHMIGKIAADLKKSRMSVEFTEEDIDEDWEHKTSEEAPTIPMKEVSGCALCGLTDDDRLRIELIVKIYETLSADDPMDVEDDSSYKEVVLDDLENAYITRQHEIEKLEMPVTKSQKSPFWWWGDTEEKERDERNRFKVDFITKLKKVTKLTKDACEACVNTCEGKYDTRFCDTMGKFKQIQDRILL